MAKSAIAGLTIVAVFLVAEIRVHRSESAEEASAVAALRAVATAQHAYVAVNGGYAMSLKTLAAPCSGEHGFISPLLSDDPATMGNYQIRVQADADAPAATVDCHGNRTGSRYYATALPLRRGGPAMRAFAVDQNEVIWYDATGAALKPPFVETAAVKRLR